MAVLLPEFLPQWLEHSARGSTVLNQQNTTLRMMKIQRFAPVIAALLGCLFFLTINLVVPQSAASHSQQPHYLIKPLHADRVLYVQPRLALGNLAPDSLLTALEEISQRYAIKASKLYTRQVNGREIPGLLVFTAPLTSQATNDTPSS